MCGMRVSGIRFNVSKRSFMGGKFSRRELMSGLKKRFWFNKQVF